MEMSVALTTDARIAAELRSQDVRVAILGPTRISRPFSVSRARRALDTLLRAERPDVVVCHQPWPLAVFGPLVRRAGIPLVLWMHMAAGRHWIDRLAWRVMPETVVCNSRFTASTLPKTAAQSEVVYVPVDLGTSHSAPARAPNATVVIIQVSRMEAWKGHAVLIDALARMRDRQGWECWLVGGAQRPAEERYQRSLRSQAAANGIADRVAFLGQRSDVADMLARADIYCQPNIEPEPFGISLIEAMAAGLPVVTSAFGGAQEIVDGTCGVLVPPRDAGALSIELSSLLDDRSRRERLGAGGPARARALCDPATQMPRIAAILQRASSAAEARQRERRLAAR